jgi:hypothetical protein
MGLLDIQGEAPEKKPYQFASAGIDDYIGELNQPKQAHDIDEAEGLEELDDMQPEPDTEPLEKLKASNSVAKASGSLLTIALDTSLSTAFGLWAGDEPQNYKADENEREELEQAIGEYVKLKGGDIPPGFALVLIILSIYGSKGAMAFQFKKAKKQLDEKDNRIAELEQQVIEARNTKTE